MFRIVSELTQNIRFCGDMTSGFSSGNTHIDFEMIDGSTEVLTL